MRQVLARDMDMQVKMASSLCRFRYINNSISIIAVLVDNSSLFILFGSDGTKLHTDFYVLDIDDGYIWKSYVPPELRKSDFSSNSIPWQVIVCICVGLGVVSNQNQY